MVAYAKLLADHLGHWRTRPNLSPESLDASAEVSSLREVSAKTVRDICHLSIAPGQERFVAPNSVSIAEAYFCEKAWFRAIYAEETPVGLLML